VSEGEPLVGDGVTQGIVRIGDTVYRQLWEDGAKVYLPRAEVWVREMAPAITARLTQSS
jgi:hypothetical protein